MEELNYNSNSVASSLQLEPHIYISPIITTKYLINNYWHVMSKILSSETSIYYIFPHKNKPSKEQNNKALTFLAANIFFLLTFFSKQSVSQPDLWLLPKPPHLCHQLHHHNPTTTQCYHLNPRMKTIPFCLTITWQIQGEIGMQPSPFHSFS